MISEESLQCSHKLKRGPTFGRGVAAAWRPGCIGSGNFGRLPQPSLEQIPLLRTNPQARRAATAGSTARSNHDIAPAPLAVRFPVAPFFMATSYVAADQKSNSTGLHVRLRAPLNLLSSRFCLAERGSDGSRGFQLTEQGPNPPRRRGAMLERTQRGHPSIVAARRHAL